MSAELSAEPATVDDDVWEAELTRECAALGEEHAELAATAPEDADGARRHAAAVATFTAGYAEAFRSVDDPAGDTAAGRVVRQLAGRLADAGRELDEAARGGDAAAADRAVRRLDRVGSALDAALAAWDVESCRGFGGLAVTSP